MAKHAQQADSTTKRIEALLKEKFASVHRGARIKVYRYNPGAIRIRVVDVSFAGKSIGEREQEVWELLDELPEKVRMEVSVCLLLTPEEQPTSLMNLEFEEPLPSGF